MEGIDIWRVVKAVENAPWTASTKSHTPSQDPLLILQSIEAGRQVPTDKNQSLNFYAGVLALALPMMAPQPEIRYWGIQKALAVVVEYFRGREAIVSEEYRRN
jgi:hypothetical protein